MKIRMIVLVGVCALMLLLPVAASADTPSESAYSGQGAEQVNASQTGSLPFTGINVATVGGIAVVLLGSGLLLRRNTRSSER